MCPMTLKPRYCAQITSMSLCPPLPSPFTSLVHISCHSSSLETDDVLVTWILQPSHLPSRPRWYFPVTCQQTPHQPDVDLMLLMLVHRLRRWTNIKPTSGQLGCPVPHPKEGHGHASPDTQGRPSGVYVALRCSAGKGYCSIIGPIICVRTSVNDVVLVLDWWVHLEEMC